MGLNVGVPAYSLQRVQSCVTEAEAPCLCSSLQEGDVGIPCAAVDVFHRNKSAQNPTVYPGRSIPVAPKQVSQTACGSGRVNLCTRFSFCKPNIGSSVVMFASFHNVRPHNYLSRMRQNVAFLQNRLNLVVFLFVWNLILLQMCLWLSEKSSWRGAGRGPVL